MAIANLNTLCRLCLDPSEMLYKLDSDFCILVMESGASVTIADAMKYLAMDIKIAPEEKEEENEDLDEEDQKSEDEENLEPKLDDKDDDSLLPKSLCQDCLEKLQSAYEFKYRCEENKNFLRNYLKDCADSKAAEERAAKNAALAALDLDVDILDLPDKLVLKVLKKEKKPRKPRDPSKPPIARRRRVAEKNVIIAEDSQVESAAYVRKLVTTPEQSPEQRRGSKRKSKHVVIEDILVGDKSSKKVDPKKQKDSKTHDYDSNGASVKESKPLPTKAKESKSSRDDDEPIFEDDDDFEEEPQFKKSKRSKN